MVRKTSLKESTRRKGQLRIDQQKAARKSRGVIDNEGEAPRKSKAKAKAKKKRVRTVSGVASLLKSRGRLE